MKEGPSVLVVGSPSRFFEREEGLSVTREGIKRYLEHLDDNFESIDYFSEKGYGPGSSSCLLDIDRERLHTQSTSNPMYFFFDLVRNYAKILMRRGNQELISLVYVPSMFSFLLSPILIYKSDKIVLYYMSDTRKVIWDDDISGRFKNQVYLFFDRILMSNADAVLFRDEAVTERSSSSDQRFVRSKPIMALDVEEPLVKEDTCDSEPVTILYVGSLIERKGVDYLVRAFEEVQNGSDETEFELKIVGDGPVKEELVDLCERLGIGQSVEFVGYISEERPLLQEYRSADIFVLPSLQEGFPRVITEAMSQSLPVITTRVGEIDDRLDEEQAVIIEPESTDDITEAIQEVVSATEFRRDLITNGRGYVEEILSGSAGDQHISLIKSLSERG